VFENEALKRVRIFILPWTS